MTIDDIFEAYRKSSFSKEDLGSRFEHLMQLYLLTDQQYAVRFEEVWLWNEFFARDEFGGKDIGIDLVAKTVEDEFFAIQCKCYQEGSYVDKPAVDTFLSTSSKKFHDKKGQMVGFARRMLISTTNNWSSNAEEAIQNQNPPLFRIRLHNLQQAPVDWEKLYRDIHGKLARMPKKELKPHQVEALNKTHAYFKKHDRGKLIMACGTGKYNEIGVMPKHECRKCHDRCYADN